MKPKDTKEKIMDAAEELFSVDGYRGTSLRAITGKAGVNLAAVNYHFGSKDALLEEVIKRRILPLNRVRIERLEKVRKTADAKGRKPDIRAVLTAFVEPTIMFRDSSPGAKNFVAFIGRSFTDPDDTVRNIFLQFVMPLFKLLLKTTSEALPDLPDNVLFWRIHFMIGSLMHTMHSCGNISKEFLKFDMDVDSGTLVDLIIPFITAGMRAR